MVDRCRQILARPRSGRQPTPARRSPPVDRFNRVAVPTGDRGFPSTPHLQETCAVSLAVC
jgi:hypothetical protein